MVYYNINFWFWFRVQWYGKGDEKDYLNMPWVDVEEAYMTNMTTVLHALTGDYLKGVKLIALQTTPGTKANSRIKMPKVMHLNSAIRSLASSANANVDSAQ